MPPPPVWWKFHHLFFFFFSAPSLNLLYLLQMMEFWRKKKLRVSPWTLRWLRRSINDSMRTILSWVCMKFFVLVTIDIRCYIENSFNQTSSSKQKVRKVCFCWQSLICRISRSVFRRGEAQEEVVGQQVQGQQVSIWITSANIQSKVFIMCEIDLTRWRENHWIEVRKAK